MCETKKLGKLCPLSNSNYVHEKKLVNYLLILFILDLKLIIHCRTGAKSKKQFYINGKSNEFNNVLGTLNTAKLKCFDSTKSAK